MPQHTAESMISQADKKLGEIRKLGAKPEKRWFGVGPKKKLTQQDRLRMNELSKNELSLRSKGMQMRRVRSGATKMVGGKETRNR